jgi:type I restriction enzyme S subunit
LSEIAKPVARSIPVVPGRSYRTIGVRWWGEGAYERETIDGSRTAAKTLSLVRQGDLIINKIWVRHGSTAIASGTVDGCSASGEFPTFELNLEKVIPDWIHWQTKTRDFWAKCDALSRGTSGKNRIKPELFLTVQVPLPPVPEQRRVVGRIEDLSHQIYEAQSLRETARNEAAEMMASRERAIWPIKSMEGAPTLESLTSFLARGRQSEQGESNHLLIKTQHVQQDHYIPTTLHLAPHIAAKVRPEALVRDRDILIACSAAGCLGRVAQYKHDGRVASTDTHIAIARANPDIVEPDYLYAYLRGAQGQYELRSRERGDWKREKISFRLTELNLNDLKKVPVPIPHRSEQRRIVAQLNELETEVKMLTRLQAQTAQEINALLPSILSQAFEGGL